MAITPRRSLPPFKVTPLVFQVLFSLSEGDAHAYGIMKDIASRTRERLDVAPGSLHFTLSKLLDAKLIQESTGPAAAADADARRKYYRLTSAGRSLLRDEVAALTEIVDLARARRLAPRR